MPWELPGDLETPALVVDLDVLETNLTAMARGLAARAVELRPHAKTHKSVEIARRQLDAGAIGLTVATLGEAEVFATAGFDDLFIAYPLVALGAKATRLRALAERARIRVGVDTEEAARILGQGTKGAPGIEVVIEVDSGHHRSGVQPALVAPLAEACRSEGLHVVGAFTFPGHAYAGPGSLDRAAHDEVRALTDAEGALRAAGFDVEVRSGGSTPTTRRVCDSTGSPVDIGPRDGVTEEQRPGVYVFNDRVQVALGTCRPEQVALVVAATVVSTAGDGTFVLDAGSKALSPERFDYLAGYAGLAGGDQPVVARLSEHHGVVDPAPSRPSVGDVVAVVPNHVCSVVDHFDHYVVTRGGRVVDRWPVDARGRLT